LLYSQRSLGYLLFSRSLALSSKSLTSFGLYPGAIL
jgi:hypothetical protein